jgi:hypothetical protein
LDLDVAGSLRVESSQLVLGVVELVGRASAAARSVTSEAASDGSA